MVKKMRIKREIKELPEADTRKKLSVLARSAEVFRRSVEEGTPMEEMAEEYGVTVTELQRGLTNDLQVFARDMAYSREIYRAVELQRLEKLQTAFWDSALAGNATDARLVLQIMEKRSKMLGLDAPKEVNIRDWRAAVEELGIKPDVLLHTVAGELKSARGTEISSSAGGDRQYDGRGSRAAKD